MHRQRTYEADLRSQSRSSSNAESSSQNHSLDLAIVVFTAKVWVKQLGNLPTFQDWCCLDVVISHINFQLLGYNTCRMLSFCINTCFVYALDSVVTILYAEFITLRKRTYPHNKALLALWTFIVNRLPI